MELYQKLASGKILSKVFDYYPYPYTPKKISLTVDNINKTIGVEIAQPKIISILKSLGFGVKLKSNDLEVLVPSYRAHDVDIPEDIIEEIARIYGYYKLPPEIISGAIPLENSDPIFAFETKLRNYLRGFGALEIYTLALVAKEFAGKDALRLKNPLGEDTAYLRTSLVPSLLAAKDQNLKHDKFHLFEIANVYLPSKSGLPEERLHLAGVFKGFDYAHAKGQLEALFAVLHINTKFEMEDNSIAISADSEILGYLEIQKGSFTYELSVQSLLEQSKPYVSYKPAPKYPPQVEDLTFVIGKNKKVGDILEFIKTQKQISNTLLQDIYQNAYTFRIYYQDPGKTLTDKEVEKIREKLIKSLEKKFAISVKS